MFILGNKTIEQWYDNTADSVSDFVNRTGNFFDGVKESANESYGSSGASEQQMDAMKFIIAMYITYTVITITTCFYKSWGAQKTRQDQGDGKKEEEEKEEEDTDAPTAPNYCHCLAEDVVNHRTAKYIANLKERHRKKMISVNNAFDFKNETIETLKKRLSENYQAVQRIFMDKTDLNLAELRTLISCVLPNDWTQIEYHEEIEDLTTDYRLDNLRRMRAAKRTAKTINARTDTQPPTYSCQDLNIDNVD